MALDVPEADAILFAIAVMLIVLANVLARLAEVTVVLRLIGPVKLLEVLLEVMFVRPVSEEAVVKELTASVKLSKGLV